MLGRLRLLARSALRDAYALALAFRDPRVPWCAKLLAAVVVAYAVSPIDLIPDFIPVLGYLDDLILLPLGVWVVVGMLPPGIMDDLRQKASAGVPPGSGTTVGGLLAAAVVVVLWGAAMIAIIYLALPFLRGG